MGTRIAFGIPLLFGTGDAPPELGPDFELLPDPEKFLFARHIATGRTYYVSRRDGVPGWTLLLRREATAMDVTVGTLMGRELRPGDLILDNSDPIYIPPP